MADDLKAALYGKTKEVILANGDKFVMREPDIDSLIKIKVDLNNINDFNTIKRLVFTMLKHDNANINEENIGKLITFSMLQPSHDFMKSFMELNGIGDQEKNVRTGEQP